MKKFEIETREVLAKTITIEANSMEDAINQAKEKYYQEDLVLDYSDLIQTDFDISTFKDIENNPRFSAFVLKSAEEMISHLSIKELAVIGCGSLLSAMENFNSSEIKNKKK